MTMPIPAEFGTRLVAVAVKDVGGTIHSLPQPARHHNVIHQMAECGIPQDYDPRAQGFLTDTGFYLPRCPALQFAIERGQIKDEKAIIGSILTSEDLW